jgi:hypothetical protein
VRSGVDKENHRQGSVREGDSQRRPDNRCMQSAKRAIIVSTQMTVTRDCTFFQRRQRSKCTGGEVRARRGGQLVSDRADFRNELVPTEIRGLSDERHLKLLAPPHKFPRSKIPLTHSQWLQDLLPALCAKLPDNWLLLLPRSAPLSLLFVPVLPLPPRSPSPPASSRSVVSRPLTSLAPRRSSTVILNPRY